MLKKIEFITILIPLDHDNDVDTLLSSLVEVSVCLYTGHNTVYCALVSCAGDFKLPLF